MKVAIVPIGNSRGIRIPKRILDECRFEGFADLETRKNRLILRPIRGPREGWADAFRRHLDRGRAELRDWKNLPPTRFEALEWEW